MVINYELSHDPEVHIHRIGRTARAGESGLAISFAHQKRSSRQCSGRNVEYKTGLAISPFRFYQSPLVDDNGTTMY